MAPHPDTLPLRKQSNGQWLLLVLVLAALGVVMASAQWRDYREVERAEREQLLTQTRVADELITAQIRSADAALRTMIASMERWRGPGSYLPFAQDHLKRFADMMPGARTFSVLSPQGICQLSSRPDLLGMDVSTRPYFVQAAADKTGQFLHVSEPYQTVLEDWTVTIARAIVRPNGEFGGVVTATLSPDYFESIMKNLRYASDMRVTLVHDQGHIYVTSPPNLPLLTRDERVIVPFLDAHIHTDLLATHDLDPDPGLDGGRRLAMARTVALENLRTTHHFVAVTSREIGAVFGAWQVMTLVLFGLWLMVAVLSCWALWRYQKNAAILYTKAQLAEHALRRSNQRFEQLAHTIPCMLFDFEVTRQGQVEMTYVSPYSQMVLGLAPEVMLADASAFFDLIHPDDRARCRDVIHQAILRREAFDCEFRLRSSSGVLRWVKSTASPAPSGKDSIGTHFSGFLFDITETKTQQLQLLEIAYQDPLTQADNRRSFMEKLQAELQRVQRYDGQASLLMLDIDYFKRVNDNHGHLVGDAVLKQLSAVLREGLRSMDALGRIGGEEFAVLLPDTNLEAAILLANRLRQAVQDRPVTEGEHTVHYTISVGVTSIIGQTADVKDVLKTADLAMYQAKRHGRNQVCSAVEAPAAAISVLSD